VTISEVKETPDAFRRYYVAGLAALASELGADTLLLATVKPWPIADRDAVTAHAVGIKIVPIDQSVMFNA